MMVKCYPQKFNTETIELTATVTCNRSLILSLIADKSVSRYFLRSISNTASVRVSVAFSGTFEELLPPAISFVVVSERAFD